MSEKFSCPAEWREWEERRAANRADGRMEKIDFDSFPILPGESSREYGDRLKGLHEKLKKAEETGSPDKIREMIEAKIGTVYTREEAEEKIARMTEKMNQRKEIQGLENKYMSHAEEMNKRLEARGQVSFAEKVANQIKDEVDEATIREALISKDNSKIFAILARLPKAEGIRDEKDRAEYEEELRRRTAEGHERYDAIIGEAMKIVEEKHLGEQVNKVIEREEEIEGEEGEKSREEMRDELLSVEAAKWLVEQGKIQLKDVGQLSDEELKGLYAQWIEYKSKMTEDKKEEKEEEKIEKKPLIAVGINRTRDAEAAARDIAERMLREDLASGKGLGKFIKGIWKGNMFRGYYVEKNRKAAYERILEKQSGKGGELGDHEWQDRSQATIDRFISEYDEMIHKDAGEWREALPDDHPAAMGAKEAIAKFARGELDEANFTAEMSRVKALLKDAQGNPKGDVVLDNYLEIARAAKGRFEHEEGIESIMEGFKLIHGEARANVRTEAHLKGFDKIMNWYEHSAVGRFVPPELVAGAASIAGWLALGATKNAARAALFGAGGAVVTGIAAGFKEGSRVSVDRAQMARERASGLEVGGTKYDAKIMGTLYELAPASTMIEALNAAIKSGDATAIMGELASAEVRTMLSDGKKVDLIGYSDPAKIEDERFALDLARATAKAKLREIGKLDEFTSGIEAVRADSERGMDAKDKAFRQLRRRQMLKQGAKTAAVAAGSMIVTQELVAAFSPNSYGLADRAFEKAGVKFETLNIGVNNAEAHNTMLAGWLGFKGPDGVLIAGTERIDAQEATGVKLTDEEVAQLREEGYTVNQVENTTFQNQEVELGAKEYAEQYGVRVSRDDWGSNGTKAFDGNELSAHYTTNGDGIVTRMSGSSTTWGGEAINFQEAVNEGKIKAFISLTGDSQSMPIEVAGRMVSNGSQLEFIPDPGTAAAECFKDGKFLGKYFEIAFDNGVDANGVQHMIPLATVVGKGMEDAAFAATEQIPVTDVAYNVLGFDRVTEAVQVVGDGRPNPAALLPFVRRDNLTAARRREQPAGQTTPTPPVTPPEGGGQTESEQPLAVEQETQTEEGGGDGKETTPEDENGSDGAGTGQESETTTEVHETERNDYDEDGEPIWENLADRIGGEFGVRLVEGGMDNESEGRRKLIFQSWWTTLSDEMKDRFAGRSENRLFPKSEALSGWLKSTGKMVETEGGNAAPQGEAMAA